MTNHYIFILNKSKNVKRHFPLNTIDWLSSIFDIAKMKFSSSYKVSLSFAYGWVRAIFNIVINACYILGGPSSRAKENCLHVNDSKIVGKSVVLSLHIWEIETAAEVLNTSFFVVWYMLSNKVATSSVAKLHPALID